MTDSTQDASITSRAPSTLAELIALAESSGNSQAIRFEPAYTPDTYVVNKCKNANGGNNCTGLTAQTLCKFSYGLYQLMGESIYRLNYTGSVFDFVASVSDQLMLFNEFIDSRYINYSLDDILHNTSKRENFAHHYNGSIITYSNHLLDVYKNAGGLI